jgi:hypothetical protein
LSRGQLLTAHVYEVLFLFLFHKAQAKKSTNKRTSGKFYKNNAQAVMVNEP